MENKKNGIGVSTILFLIFLTLKLTKNIDWNWWWVTSPIWVPLCIAIIIFLVVFIFFLIWGILLLLSKKDPDIIKNKFEKFLNKKPIE